MSYVNERGEVDASDPIPRKFKNVMRCTVSEVITMSEAVDRGRYFKGLPDGVLESEPYWDFFFEALDARWLRDGTALSWKAAGRLFTKEGKKADNTAKPYRVSMAFAGLIPPVSVFPGDPEGKFDAFCASINREAIGLNPNFIPDAIIARVFLCEIETVDYGTDMPLPITAYPEGYIFTDKIRELGSSEGGPTTDSAPVTNTLIDVLSPGGEEGLAKLLGILNGQPTDTDLFDLLRAGGLDNRTLIGGESVLGVAVNDGVLIEKLQQSGHIKTLDGDRIEVA